MHWNKCFLDDRIHIIFLNKAWRSHFYLIELAGYASISDIETFGRLVIEEALRLNGFD